MWHETVDSSNQRCSNYVINSNLNRYSTCRRTARKKRSRRQKDTTRTLLRSRREKGEKVQNEKEEEGGERKRKLKDAGKKTRDYTRCVDLTQDKQLTKHAQKLITAFTKRMSMIDIYWMSICVSSLWRRTKKWIAAIRINWQTTNGEWNERNVLCTCTAYFFWGVCSDCDCEVPGIGGGGGVYQRINHNCAQSVCGHTTTLSTRDSAHTRR